MPTYALGVLAYNEEGVMCEPVARLVEVADEDRRRLAVEGSMAASIGRKS